MRIRAKNYLTVALFLFAAGLMGCAFLSGFAHAGDHPVLFQLMDGDSEKGRAGKPMDLSLESIRVQVDFSLLQPEAASAKRVHAPLPDTMVILNRERHDVRGADDYTWIGSVEGEELSSAVMTVVHGVMYGHIDTGQERYELSPDADGYRVTKVDRYRAAPFGDDAVVLERGAHGGPSTRSVLSAPRSSQSVFDLLVLYTSKMSQKYGSGLDSVLQYFVDVANTAYSKSGVNAKLNIISKKLFTDAGAAENVTIGSALDYIHVNSSVASARNAAGADLVTLMRVWSGNTSSPCGLGFLMTSQWVGPDFAANAFSVVEVLRLSDIGGSGYYCPDITLVHELGHNMGCSHDRNQGGYGTAPQGAFSYSYGYDKANVFATIMSYDRPSITYFSTPNVTYQGYPIGKNTNQPDSAYNVLTLNNTRDIVAGFRDGFAADFTASSVSGKAPFTVQFTDKSRGSINSWAWKFGDGTTSRSKSPKHTYQKVGKYTVSLTVSGPSGSSTKTRSSYITVKEPAPTANFNASPTSGKAPLTVNFQDTSTGSITSRAWTFGDGLTSTNKNPSHTYKKAGTYKATLKVTGSTGSTTKSRTITVSN